MHTPQEEPKISHAGAVADAKQLIHRLYGESTGQSELKTSTSRDKSQGLFEDLSKPGEEAPKDAPESEILYREAGAFLAKFGTGGDDLGMDQIKGMENSGMRLLSEVKRLEQGGAITKTEANRLEVVLGRFTNLARKAGNHRSTLAIGGLMSGNGDLVRNALAGQGGGGRFQPNAEQMAHIRANPGSFLAQMYKHGHRR